jgi:hypothetical protein
MSEKAREWTYNNTPKDGSAFPADLVEILWSYVSWDDMKTQVGCSKERLQSLIFPAFQASLQSEENRPVRLRIRFQVIPDKDTLLFSQPISSQ